MIDIERIKRRIAEIKEAVAEIKRLTAKESDEFWLAKENIAAVKYYLIQAIEAVGAICVHIAAKKFNKAISSFGECIEVLGNENFFDADLLYKLKEIAKFRNKLIHRYWEIDDRLVLKYAKEEIDDFEDFSSDLSRVLQD